MHKGVINVVTLGCSKNVVDSEYLMGHLRRDQYRFVHDSDSTQARTVVINTCGFIGDAKEESIDTILRFADAKKKGYIDRLYVMGCLSERYKEELRAEIAEVDEFFGVNQLPEVVGALGGNYRSDLIGARYLTTPSHYAYLKISEGCNWGCGYCAIPLIRGRYRSVPMESLVSEAAYLAGQGVRELMVIAQDTTYYGKDLYGERKLGVLLRRLCAVEGLEWIRLHYAYPADFPMDVVEVLRDEPKMCKYLDIPFQHISDSQLRSMRRGIDRRQTLDLIGLLRREIPALALRTTLLTGYPGESASDFEELTDFVREVCFERLGVFPYSSEEGTYSALHLRDDVPLREKRRRVETLMSLQSGISGTVNRRRIGTHERVIVDRQEGDYWVTRSQYDSPEVDTEILVSCSEALTPGLFYEVEIISSDDYDLYGILAE